MENLEIYEKYRKVPANACKPFDNGKFKGTDINSMWRIKCLTEQFGIVGIGWNVRIVRTWTEPGANEEVLAFAEIAMKVKVDGEWSEEWTATGGNTMIKYSRKNDMVSSSDEAFKMAITDAFGVACKYLGIGADIYWENDKSKYTAEEVKPSLSAETLSACKEMQIDLNRVAAYLKKKTEDLTDAEVMACVERKRGQTK